MFISESLPDVFVSTPTCSVDIKELRNAVNTVKRLCSNRVSLPILDTVRLGEGRVIATDLETGCSINVSGLSIPPVCIPVKALLAALKPFKKGDITLAAGENDILTINGTVKLQGLSAAEYPAVSPVYTQTDSLPDYLLDCKNIDRVIPAMSDDGTRPNMTGVFVDTKKGKLVASDGHRLHSFAIAESECKPFFLPYLTADLLSCLSGRGPFAVRLTDAPLKEGEERKEWELRYPDYLSLTGEDCQISVRLDGVSFFPDYDQVTSGCKEGRAIIVKKAELQEALSACKSFTTKRSKGIRLDCLGNSLKVSITTPDVGAVERMIPFHGPEGLTVGFNVNYLLDVIDQAMNDNPYIALQVRDEQRAAWVQEDGFFACVMPMRIF